MFPVHKAASPISLYFKVMLELREKIISGEWIPGSQIPTEVDLAKAMGVSLITVRQALGQLVQEGYIRRLRAKGSFVSETVPHRQYLNLHIEVDEVINVQPETKFRLVGVQQIEPSRILQRKFALAESETVTRVIRVRMQNEHPLGYIESCLPYRFAREIPKNAFQKLPLAHLLESYASIVITEVKHTVGAVLADTQVSEHLEVPSGDPLLLIERDYVRKNEVVAVSTGFYRSDLYRYELNLKRRSQSTQLKGGSYVKH